MQCCQLLYASLWSYLWLFNICLAANFVVKFLFSDRIVLMWRTFTYVVIKVLALPLPDNMRYLPWTGICWLIFSPWGVSHNTESTKWFAVEWSSIHKLLHHCDMFIGHIQKRSSVASTWSIPISSLCECLSQKLWKGNQTEKCKTKPCAAQLRPCVWMRSLKLLYVTTWHGNSWHLVV